MNRLIKNYIYNLLYQVFLIIVPLITAPYLTRVLTSNSLGIYDYVNSVVSIITTLGLLGLHSYGYRQIAYYRDDLNKVNQEFSSIYQLRMCLMIVATIIYIPIAYKSEFREYFLIQYFLIMAQFIDISWVFIGFEDLKIVSFRNFIAKFITVVGIFLFVRDDNDLWIYFFLFGIITLLTTISVFPLAKKYVKFQKCSLKQSIYHIIPAVKLFIPQFATLLYLQVDKIMLNQITNDASQVAYYSYAEKIINIPLAIITALGTVMMPRLANLYMNNEESQMSLYLRKTITFAMFLAIPMMVGISGISTKFVPWYLGTEYTASILAIIVLSPICILNALTNILGAQYLTAANKTRILAISYYSAAVVNLVLNAILIPYYGYVGAAIATVVCSLVSLVIQYIYVNKNIDIKGIKGQIIKNAISSLAMLGIIVIIGSIMKISALTTLIQIVSGLLVYIIFSYILKDEILMYALKKIKLLIRR